MNSKQAGADAEAKDNQFRFDSKKNIIITEIRLPQFSCPASQQPWMTTPLWFEAYAANELKFRFCHFDKFIAWQHKTQNIISRSQDPPRLKLTLCRFTARHILVTIVIQLIPWVDLSLVPPKKKFHHLTWFIVSRSWPKTRIYNKFMPRKE